MRERFIQTLLEQGKRDERLVLLTGDLGFGVFDEFRKKLPAQFLNAGVAEQNMLLVATGLALEGHVVFVYSIGNFATLRCVEMIRNGPAYHGANVNIVSAGAGFSYGQLGFSHHATEDLAILRAIPDVAVFSPTGQWEVEQVTRWVCGEPGPSYIRLDKDPGFDPPTDQGSAFEPALARTIRAGRDIALFATGGILSEVVRAGHALVDHGFDPSIYSMPALRPVDTTALAEILRRYRTVVTVEEHVLTGGFGSLILEIASDQGLYGTRVFRFGLAGFSTIVGSQEYLRRHNGLDAAAITRRVLDLAGS